MAVNAKVMYIEGFSSHSDYDDTLNWLSHFSKPPYRTFIVHGEPYSAKALAEKIGTHLGWETYIPAYLDKIYLG